MFVYLRNLSERRFSHAAELYEFVSREQQWSRFEVLLSQVNIQGAAVNIQGAGVIIQGAAVTEQK